MIDNQEFIVFSDESHITGSRYRCISSISFPASLLDELNSGLSDAIVGVSEFKWKNFKGAKYRNVAQGILSVIFDNLPRGVRVDTLTWDTHDDRHKVRGRDDTANFGRMYFHLLKTVMNKRGGKTIWNVYPDEHLGLDWDTLHDCLGSVGRWVRVRELPLFGLIDVSRNYKITRFEQCKSHENPVCQACDLFAGMTIYSYENHEKYNLWLNQNSSQNCFEELEPEGIVLSSSDKERMPFFADFLDQCKKQKLGVSYNTYRSFRTHKPSNPLNFWHYKPQHKEDKAPIKIP